MMTAKRITIKMTVMIRQLLKREVGMLLLLLLLLPPLLPSVASCMW